MVVDFAADDTPLGLEIVNPATTDEDTLLAVLAEIRAPAVSRDDLAPLRAARADLERPTIWGVTRTRQMHEDGPVGETR